MKRISIKNLCFICPSKKTNILPILGVLNRKKLNHSTLVNRILIEMGGQSEEEKLRRGGWGKGDGGGMGGGYLLLLCIANISIVCFDVGLLLPTDPYSMTNPQIQTYCIV